jgi:predicted TIM-barrel fold metal-dependent hydrolase
MKIDMYAHICPQKFIDTLNKQGSITWEQLTRTSREVGGPGLWDVDARLRTMEKYEDYVQVLTSSGEVVAPYFKPQKVIDFVKLINDEMAEVVRKHPDKFIGAVATLPETNIDAAMKEIERTVDGMGFKGIQLHTPIFQYEEGRPVALGGNPETAHALDSPEFLPIYEAMSKRNLPIWIHPVGFGGTPV